MPWTISTLLAAAMNGSSVSMQRDSVRAQLRTNPSSMSISWMIQPKQVNGKYTFANYYESSSFVHSINGKRLEFSLIMRKTRDNTMGFFINWKNVEEDTSLSMHADFVMKKEYEPHNFRSFCKSKTDHFILDSINNSRGIFNYCDMQDLNQFVTSNLDIPYVVLCVNTTDISTRTAAPLKLYVKT